MIHRSVVDAEILEKTTKFDHYATSKSVSQTMLDMSAIQSLLVILIKTFKTSLSGYEIATIVFCCVALVLQFIIFVLLVVLAKSRKEQISKTCTTTSINTLVTSLSGLLVIVTSAISILAVTSTSDAITNSATRPINTTLA